MTEKRLYSDYRTGKCIMQEIEWANLKCSNCGAEMPKYPYYDNNKNEIKTCEECGETHILVRHILKVRK